MDFSSLAQGPAGPYDRSAQPMVPGAGPRGPYDRRRTADGPGSRARRAL